jgi:hypothetical protein
VARREKDSMRVVGRNGPSTRLHSATTQMTAIFSLIILAWSVTLGWQRIF